MAKEETHFRLTQRSNRQTQLHNYFQLDKHYLLYDRLTRKDDPLSHQAVLLIKSIFSRLGCNEVCYQKTETRLFLRKARCRHHQPTY